MIRKFKAAKYALTIGLAFAGVVIMLWYASCTTNCSMLRGDILGIDLKIVGIIYMAAIIGLTIGNLMPLVRVGLAAGLGVEVYLYTFQIQNDVYCPFCLAFSVLLIAAFLINYELPNILQEKKYHLMIFYFLGDEDLLRVRVPLLLFSIIGYTVIYFTFNGSVVPSFDGAEALFR